MAGHNGSGTVPAIDFDDLATRCFDDAALQADLVGLFAEQCDRLLPLIAAGPDRDARARAAHTLRGAALAVGGSRIAECTGRLEDSFSRADEQTGERECLSDLAEAVAEAALAIARWRATRAAGLANPAALA